MAAEAESSRLANAKIIVAKAEIEATKNLQKASTILADNPFTMQVANYYQYVLVVNRFVLGKLAPVIRSAFLDYLLGEIVIKKLYFKIGVLPFAVSFVSIKHGTKLIIM